MNTRTTQTPQEEIGELYDRLKAALHAAPVGSVEERAVALERLRESRFWIDYAFKEQRVRDLPLKDRIAEERRRS